MTDPARETTDRTDAAPDRSAAEEPPPLRIACVIHSLDGGGAERVMAGLSGRLAGRRHSVDLITLDNGTRRRHPLSDAVRWIPLDVMSTTRRHVGSMQRIKRLRAAIGQADYDVVLSFCDATNLLVLLATRGLRRCPRIVVSERSDPAHQSLGRLREWLRERLYPQADAVVCLSENVAATFNQRMKANTLVIESAVEPPPPGYTELRAAKRVTSPIRLIAIGRLEREKGFDRLLEALAAITREADSPAWTLKVLGDGNELQDLETLAREHPLSDRIEFSGWVDSVWPYLAESDVFVLPSRYEGFPSALLEAMAGGLTVLAVDAGGGVRSAIRHGENGWLVDNSTTALTAGLRTILNDASLRANLAATAPQTISQFGWDPMVDAYERVLRG